MKSNSTRRTSTRKALTLAMALSSTFLSFGIAAEGASERPAVNQTMNVQQVKIPRIQVAILLDTSGSMDGLINQTREQLWNMVDEFSKAKRNGIKPVLEVAVYEYGNDKLSSENGFVRQLTGLSRDLDVVSEALFSLTTDGGSEYCGYAIDTATKELQWSSSDADLKAIFIAGNEPFTQGPIRYSSAIEKAKQMGIKVNTIFAGNYQEGLSTGWQEGAVLAGGDYMNINQNQQTVHYVAPQDQRIAELNQQLNQTYVPYGSKGKKAVQRQQAQDKNSNDVSIGLLAKRVKSKVSAAYNASAWDLVDAIEDGEVALEEVPAESLPASMVSMDQQERKQYLKDKHENRSRIKTQIQKLSEERDAFIADKRKDQAEADESTLSSALMGAVRKQGEAQSFEFN